MRGPVRPAAERGKRVLEQLISSAVESEQRGEPEEAGALFEQLLERAVDVHDTAALIEALRGSARVFWQLGRLEESEEVAELSREVAERTGHVQAAARAVNLLAILRHEQGDWNQARALYERALDGALDAGDDELVGLACQNLGVLNNILGNLEEARARYLECIASSVRSENKQNEMMAYNNLGMLCADLQEWMEAEEYFGRGIALARRLHASPVLGKLYVNRAEPLIHLGEHGEARSMLREAEAVAMSTRDESVLSDVWRYRGVMACRERDLDAADRHLAQALSIAAEHNLELAAAEATEELAFLRHQQGRTREAARLLRRACDTFRALRAQRDVARVEALLERWQAAAEAG
jgi:tetratricopeptide (TPR) repeat protein